MLYYHRNSGFTHWKWWCSIVFCMFTRGYPHHVSIVWMNPPSLRISIKSVDKRPQHVWGGNIVIYCYIDSPLYPHWSPIKNPHVEWLNHHIIWRFCYPIPSVLVYHLFSVIWNANLIQLGGVYTFYIIFGHTHTYHWAIVKLILGDKIRSASFSEIFWNHQPSPSFPSSHLHGKGLSQRDNFSLKGMPEIWDSSENVQGTMVLPAKYGYKNHEGF